MIARTITYLVLALLGLFVLATTFVLDHGGGAATPPAASGLVTVHDLSLLPETYRGKTIITLGTLGYSPDTAQHQVVDEGLAVVILGYDALALRSLEGQRVSVTGRFDFDEGIGIFIDADIVKAAD